MDARIRRLKKIIAKIENLYPPDDLIQSYSDFKKYRDVLHHYQYNEKVFYSLVRVTQDVWHSKKRVSRPSLITVMRNYRKKAREVSTPPTEISSYLFEIFKDVIHKGVLNHLSADTVHACIRYVNYLLAGVVLRPREVQWLVDHVDFSYNILNRVLRYPIKSDKITAWCRSSYHIDRYRHRRAELTGWILDEESDYTIDPAVIQKDFEYEMIEIEEKLDYYERWVLAYKESQLELRMMEKESWGTSLFFNMGERIDSYATPPKKKEERDVIPPSRAGDLLVPASESSPDPTYVEPVLSLKQMGFDPNFAPDTPEFNLYPTIFNRSRIHVDEYGNILPILKDCRREYEKNKKLFYTRIMLWSIAYSRMPISDKLRRFDAYYEDSLYPYFEPMGRRKLKNRAYFEWLMDKVAEASDKRV